VLCIGKRPISMMVSSVCVVDREKADIDDGEFSVC